jgi:hypothetical protein
MVSIIAIKITLQCFNFGAWHLLSFSVLAVLHSGDGSCHRVHPQAGLHPPGHQAGQPSGVNAIKPLYLLLTLRHNKLGCLALG